MTKHTSHPHGAFSWVDLPTRDLDASKAFYSGLFGWAYHDMPLGQGMIYSMCLKDGESVGAIANAFPPDMIPQVWQSFVTVNDVDAAAARVAPAGGTVLQLHDVMEAGRMARVRDPAGGTLSLWRAKQHIGAHALNEHGALAWNELRTSDVERAKKFYPAVLGWGLAEMPMGEGMVYTMFCNPAEPQKTHGGCRPVFPGEALGWHVIFCVDDCDAAVAKVAASGGKILQPAMDMPGIGRIAECADPLGGAFGLIQPAR